MSPGRHLLGDVVERTFHSWKDPGTGASVCTTHSENVPDGIWTVVCTMRGR